MGDFLAGLGKPLASRIRILSYEQIFSTRSITLPRGTYILSSLGLPLGSYEPLSPSRRLVAQMHQALVRECGPQHVLNDPIASLRRFALLRTLHERGINQFAAYPAAAVPGTARFPLFLRHEAGTQWAEIPLLRDRQQLDAALAQASNRDGLLAVEFCDTADRHGIYRKYGAFVLGNQIVPRHLFFSRHWMVKQADLKDRELLAEELAYVQSNPHAAALQQVCQLAHIQYGRIDYSMHEGQLQVWEINTTPSLVSPPAPDDALRAPANACFLAAFSAAIDAVDRSFA